MFQLPAPFSIDFETAPSLYAIISTVFMIIYPLGALFVLLYNIIGYFRFTALLRRGYVKADWLECEIARELSEDGRVPRVYRSFYAATPMLVGIFRPTIVLPDREYSEEQLHSIIFHELTHMRRWDIPVKWLFLLACALHWFNPLVWFAQREIDRICELSCDELVIRDMDARGRQNYGNTLIFVATNKKIPLPVLSTTMCNEKRALRERLTSITKSRQYTRIAVAMSLMIVLVATLTAFTVGAARSSNRIYEHAPYARAESIFKIESDVNDSDLISRRTVHDYADLYIRIVSQINIGLFDYPDGDSLEIIPANFTDTRIDHFEAVARFYHLLAGPIELWHLEFMLLTTDIEQDPERWVRWGSFAPDEYGWLGQHSGWNCANIFLAFTYGAEGLEYLGHVPWHFAFDTDTTTLWGKEAVLRRHLEAQSILPSVSFPGNHYLAYFDFGGHEDARLLLSQPISEGDIWIVERWQQIGNEARPRDPYAFITLPARPIDGDWNQTTVELAHDLQGQFDDGEAPWLADPYAVARAYLDSVGWDADYAPILELVPINAHEALSLFS